MQQGRQGRAGLHLVVPQDATKKTTNQGRQGRAGQGCARGALDRPGRRQTKQGRQGRAGLHLVVPSRGHKEDNFALAEDRRDDSDVRQVAASCQLGVVAHKHIPLIQPLLLAWTLCVVPQLQFTWYDVATVLQFTRCMFTCFAAAMPSCLQPVGDCCS